MLISVVFHSKDIISNQLFTATAMLRKSVAMICLPLTFALMMMVSAADSLSHRGEDSGGNLNCGLLCSLRFGYGYTYPDCWSRCQKISTWRRPRVNNLNKIDHQRRRKRRQESRAADTFRAWTTQSCRTINWTTPTQVIGHNVNPRFDIWGICLHHNVPTF